VDRSKIESLLPHADKMVLIDRIISCSIEMIVCGTHSHRGADNPLRTARGVSTLSGIEYGGQAIALHNALTSRLPRVEGVIAILRNLSWATRAIDTNSAEELMVTAEVIVRGSAAATYNILLDQGGRRLFSGQATIAFRLPR
jgi:predicted hotdog family 3-hydroxylacyl-ACP dehydratase